MRDQKFSSKKKERNKKIRTLFQIFVIVALLTFAIKATFFQDKYQPYTGKMSDNQETSFIAISYFGIDRGEVQSLLDRELLEEHLEALYNSGYVTITQQDILDYYNTGKTLPEKALFLMFEDGRKDTAIFAQNAIEKFNYKATLLTYAMNLNIDDSKYVSATNLKTLSNNSYWEVGTNGYRLAYINITDKDENYYDFLDTYGYQELGDQVKTYNHYLMDYIRDMYEIPKESFEEMEVRIKYDYQKLREDYLSALGEVPALYALMHSNTAGFGSNERVSNVNRDEILTTFSINFNREGNALNNPNSSLFDLTRLQPQEYWSANHLLMHVERDSGKGVVFTVGNEELAKQWTVISGVAEYKDTEIILTSPYDKIAQISFNEKCSKDVQIDVILNGQMLGEQAIYLRADKSLQTYVGVRVQNNILKIIEKANQNTKENTLYELDLNTLINNEPTDQEEIHLRDFASNKLSIVLVDDQFSLVVDGQEVSKVKVTSTVEGEILLEASHRWLSGNKPDNKDCVYDGRFSEMVITDLSNNTVVFDGQLRGWDLFLFNLKNLFNGVVDWFIQTL